jgi:hypothetical protein
MKVPVLALATALAGFAVFAVQASAFCHSLEAVQEIELGVTSGGWKR